MWVNSIPICSSGDGHFVSPLLSSPRGRTVIGSDMGKKSQKWIGIDTGNDDKRKVHNGRKDKRRQVITAGIPARS